MTTKIINEYYYLDPLWFNKEWFPMNSIGYNMGHKSLDEISYFVMLVRRNIVNTNTGRKLCIRSQIKYLGSHIVFALLDEMRFKASKELHTLLSKEDMLLLLKNKTLNKEILKIVQQYPNEYYQELLVMNELVN